VEAACQSEPAHLQSGVRPARVWAAAVSAVSRAPRGMLLIGIWCRASPDDVVRDCHWAVRNPGPMQPRAVYPIRPAGRCRVSGHTPLGCSYAHVSVRGPLRPAGL